MYKGKYSFFMYHQWPRYLHCILNEPKIICWTTSSVNLIIISHIIITDSQENLLKYEVNEILPLDIDFINGNYGCSSSLRKIRLSGLSLRFWQQEKLACCSHHFYPNLESIKSYPSLTTMT